MFRWFGDLFKSKLDKHLDRQFEEAGNVISLHARGLVGVPYPPASSPGQWPRKRTGRFQRSITFKVELKGGKRSVKVYSTVKYGDYLETGTSKMAARPWRGRSYRETRRKVERILLQPMP